MYKILRADKDAYITNHVIKNLQSTSSNVGSAATLNLEKIYGRVVSGSIPVTEVSRLLLHFNLDPIKDLVSSGTINVADQSFQCMLILKDVYGGQTTPANFTIAIYPLSSSFEEGTGRDVAYYSDLGACNFISSSVNTPWIGTGCSSNGSITSSCDFFDDYKKTQSFITGKEDLNVDVTTIVSATLSSLIPDNGFRISYDETQELDQKTYFVKRFASRHVYDESKRPALIVKYDDTIQDKSLAFLFDNNTRIFFKNYVDNTLKNITTTTTGNNCIALKLETPVSGGNYVQFFTGSQYYAGTSYVSGVYYADVFLSSSNTLLKEQLNTSGSIFVKPVWCSLTNNAETYLTSSNLQVFNKYSNQRLDLEANVSSIQGVLSYNSIVPVRVNAFNPNSPVVNVVKVFSAIKNLVISESYYSVRDIVTNETIIPFDLIATKLSSDIEGMYFNLDTSNLLQGRTYAIDLKISDKIFYDASPQFTII